MTAFSNFFNKNIKSILISWILILTVVLVISGVFAILQSAKFRISTVNVSMDRASMEYRNSMERYLAKDFLNMNKFFLSYYQLKFRSYYLQKFPWIDKIQFERQDNVLDIRVIGKRPDVYLSIDNGLFAIAENQLLPVKDTINTTGTRIPVAEIIGTKLSSTGSLDSLFFGLRIDTFVRQISLLHENIADYELLQFMPGGNKILLRNKDGVSLYFDARKNMIEQINKYRLISGSGNVIGNNKTVDLGTMDDIIFMSK